ARPQSAVTKRMGEITLIRSTNAPRRAFARFTRAVSAAAMVAAVSAACAQGDDTPAEGNATGASSAASRALGERLARLEARKTRVEDVSAIERLQHAYGYYVDEGLWDEAAGLFAADATIEIGLDGVYAGRERVREYLYALGGGNH